MTLITLASSVSTTAVSLDSWWLADVFRSSTAAELVADQPSSSEAARAEEFVITLDHAAPTRVHTLCTVHLGLPPCSRILCGVAALPFACALPWCSSCFIMPVQLSRHNAPPPSSFIADALCDHTRPPHLHHDLLIPAPPPYDPPPALLCGRQMLPAIGVGPAASAPGPFDNFSKLNRDRPALTAAVHTAGQGASTALCLVNVCRVQVVQDPS